MTPLFIILIVLLISNIAAGKRCSPHNDCGPGFLCAGKRYGMATSTCMKQCPSVEDCGPGFFCAGKEYWMSTGICKKLKAGAGPCYSFDACGRDFRCLPYNFKCVPLPDYSKSGLPEGFGACNKSWDCGQACVKKECRFDCARGRCHVPGVLDACKGRCTSLLTCVGGRCVYGTEGTSCDPSASEPCLRGLRCEKTTGQSGGDVQERACRNVVHDFRRDVDLDLCVGRRVSAPVARMGSRASLTSSARLGFCARVQRKSVPRSSCWAGRTSRFQFRLGRGRASGTMTV